MPFYKKDFSETNYINLKINDKMKPQEKRLGKNVQSFSGFMLFLLGLVGLVLISIFNNPITWGALAGIICLGIIAIGLLLIRSSR